MLAEHPRCPPPREEFGPCRFKDNTTFPCDLTHGKKGVHVRRTEALSWSASALASSINSSLRAGAGHRGATGTALPAGGGPRILAVPPDVLSPRMARVIEGLAGASSMSVSRAYPEKSSSLPNGTPGASA